MKNEIKEILDNPKILMLSYGNYISLDDYVKLKDYITNLQQKYEGAILIGKELNKDNERANQYIDFYEDLTKQQINMINDYKSRNEEAIEYITSYESISTIQGLDKIEQNKTLDEKTIIVMVNRYLEVHDKLLNILQGGDK